MFKHDIDNQPSEITENANLSHQPLVGRLILAIATTGRREVLSTTLSRLPMQSRMPDVLMLSIADEADIDRTVLNNFACPVEVVTGPKGACNQRNQVVRRLQADDVVLFTDDDFLMSSDYLEQVEKLFNTHSNVVMATGTVIADGIKTSGISHEQGVDLLQDQMDNGPKERIETTYNGYGCNMAIRALPVVQNELRFDEILPFYSWLEDVDFSRQLSDYGRIVKSNLLTGVHLGTKMGRSSGKLLGYSQISNPLYLSKKGTMEKSRAWRIMRRNIASNFVKSLRPEPWVDRRGRLYGNALAFVDLMRGRLDPQRVIEFKR